MSQKLSVQAAQQIGIVPSCPASIEPDGQTVSVTLKAINNSDLRLAPDGEYPLNFAAFIVPAEGAGPYLGDFPRYPLPRTIAPGETIPIEIKAPLPAATGAQKLVVTLVQENNFWFHLSPIGTLLEIDVPKPPMGPWWEADQADRILFGNIEELNQGRFKRYFSCGEKQRPLFLHLETVNICNLRCVICPYVSMQRAKETMPMDLFDRIIDEYIAIGGGDVGLTPSVGDVFLDKMLVQRVRSLRTRPEVKSIGFVTNAGNAGVLSDEDLSYVINECTRINISVYGLDEEENAAMTRRPGKYDQILSQMRRIVSLNEKATIVFAFRLLKPDAEARAHAWMIENFGAVMPHDILTQFSNWGGAIDTSQPLPLGGTWVDPDVMEAVSTGLPCAYPLLHLKVAVNGDVKFCSCIDYDSHPENIIGNVKEASLLDIYNGYRARRLWREGLSICKGCTHYKPVKLFSDHFKLLERPIGNLGI